MKEAIIFEIVTHAPELLGADEIPTVSAPSIAAPVAIRTSVTYKPQPINGAPLWAELHMRALAIEGNDDSRFIEEFGRRVPCGECKTHWMAMMMLTPPDYMAYFEWSVARHNEVNFRLKKPLLTVEEARKIWSPPQ